MVVVILGGVLLNRNRIGGNGDVVSDRLTEAETDEKAAASKNDTTDLDDSGPTDSADDPPDLCELLPQDVASDLARESLDEPLASKRRSRCLYPGTSDLRVVLRGHLGDTRVGEGGGDGSDTSAGLCPSVLADCGLSEDAVPGLPDGRAQWFEPLEPASGVPEPPGGWPDELFDDAPVIIRVEWMAAGRTWTLALSGGAYQPLDVILSLRDEVTAEAKDIHQEITANPDRWANL